MKASDLMILWYQTDLAEDEDGHCVEDGGEDSGQYQTDCAGHTATVVNQHHDAVHDHAGHTDEDATHL